MESMKKTNVLFAMVLMISGMMMASCESMVKSIVDKALEKALTVELQDSEEWGAVLTGEMQKGQFSEVEVSGAATVIYTQGDSATYYLKGNEKVLDNYEVALIGNKLSVKPKNEIRAVKSPPHIYIYVCQPTLESVDLTGAGNIHLMGFVCQDKPLDVEISGAGDVKIDSLQVKSFEAEVTGAGDIDVHYMFAQEEVKFEISGAGDINGRVDANRIGAEVSGAGDVDLDVNCEVLTVELSGAADAKLTGRCKQFDKYASKGSDVDASGLKVGE